MRRDATKLGERFTDLELFRMFNVDCAPTIAHKDGDRRPAIEEGMCFNDIKVSLWSEVSRPLSRGEKAALQSDDFIREGVSSTPPGSERVADLAAYYASQEGSPGPQGEPRYRDDATSAFTV